MATIEKLVSEIERTAKENDPVALNRACDDFIYQLSNEPGTLDATFARRALKALQKNRRFEQMRRVAPPIIDDGCDDAEVRRRYAQALIECGEGTLAIGVLNELVSEPKTPPAERADAKGLLGRAFKQKAVAARGKRDNVAREALTKSYNHYKDVYVENSKALYQGINRVALAAWDRGFTLSDEERKIALKTAEDILNEVTNMATDKREAWDFATAAEASIALGRDDEAADWFKKYVDHPNTDAFELGSTVRQLTEIWKLGDRPDGLKLLGPLRARLLELPGGSFTVPRHEIQQMGAVSKSDYERVLGDTGPLTRSRMKVGFDLAESIALFRLVTGRGFGTGFLVRGGDLDERLGGELLVLTNAHVISDPPFAIAVRPQQAKVTFEVPPQGADPKQEYRIEKIVWQSVPHDATLLRLTPAIPAVFKPVDFSGDLPALSEDEKHRLYIIGHPGGGELSYSFEDNELLDYETTTGVSPCRIHYRTPTERGNSGSPVFNRDWLTIAIHHSGGKEMPKLNGKLGFYGANEGIWIESIRRAMAKATLP